MRLFKKRKTVDYVFIGRRKLWYRIPKKGDRFAWAFVDEACMQVAVNENEYSILIAVKDLIGMEQWPEFLGNTRVSKAIEKTYTT